MLPSLRERVGDIPLLVRHFTNAHARKLNKPITSIPSETMAVLTRYAWPGNVREMENLVERSVILSQGSILKVPLSELLLSNNRAPTTVSLENIEREHILHILKECSWKVAGQSGAAAKLGMKRTTLQGRMKKLGIVRPQ